MKAKHVHKAENFTRGGDAYSKLGLGDSRYTKGTYVYWTSGEYWVKFPNVGLTARLTFGYVKYLGGGNATTIITNDPNEATNIGISWAGFNDSKLKEILDKYFHDNSDTLMANAQYGTK